MAKTPRVVKKHRVVNSGRAKLGQPPQGADSSTAAPVVRVLEQNEDAALIEVTCLCKRRFCLRCEFDKA